MSFDSMFECKPRSIFERPHAGDISSTEKILKLEDAIARNQEIIMRSFIMDIKMLDKLLKDELAATETYKQVLDKLREDAALGESEYLMPIYEAHKDAVSSVQAQIRQLGETPSEGSGAWGTWVEILQGGANMLGKKAALKVLQEGEKNGAEDYEKVLKDTELSSSIRSLIETKLLPAQQAHIRTLDRLLDAAA